MVDALQMGIVFRLSRRERVGLLTTHIWAELIPVCPYEIIHWLAVKFPNLTVAERSTAASF